MQGRVTLSRSDGRSQSWLAPLRFTVFTIRAWHIALLAVAAAAVVAANDQLASALPEIIRVLEPHTPFIKGALEFVPFFAVALIWISKKNLEKQVEKLGIQLNHVNTASEILGNKTDEAKGKLEVATRAIRSISQTAAEGISMSASHAETGLKAATHILDQTGRSAEQAAERASAKLADQTARLKDEIDRAIEELAPLLQRTSRGLPTDNAVSDESYWKEVRGLWKQAREDLGVLIQDIYGKYDGRATSRLNLDYRSYARVVAHLRSKGFINSDTEIAVTEMDQAFNRLKSPKNPTANDVTFFRRKLEELRQANRDVLTEFEPA